MIAVILSGCGAPPPPDSGIDGGDAGAPTDADSACVIVRADSTAEAGSIALVLTDPIRTENTPLPANDGERLLFRNLYETLVRIDCEGRIGPGLAEVWSDDGGGRTWTFVLREGARFSDGSPLLAEHVIRSWIRTRNHFALPDAPPWRWLPPENGTIDTPSSHVLRIRLARPRKDLPRILAHSAFAVMKPIGAESWPAGSGRWRVVEFTGDRNDNIVLGPNQHHPRPPDEACSIGVGLRAGKDPRDLLLPSVDGTMVRERRAARYGATHPDFLDTPLPFDRTYLLLVPPFDNRNAILAAVDDAGFREELARHVAGADARPAPPVRLPRSARDSAPSSSPTRFTRAPNLRVVYPEGDDDARRLAERITAILQSLGGRYAGVTAAELPVPSFLPAVRGGRDAAYLFPLASDWPGPVLRASMIAASAPWLVDDGGRGGAATAGPTPGIVPLIVTRAHLIVRRGVGGIETDYAGSPLFGTLRRAPEGAAP